jgi:predicted permease
MKPGESLLAPSRVVVSDGYFDAMQVPLVSGRAFNASDTGESVPVTIIDERLAAKFWPGQDAVGRRLYFPSDPQDLLKVTEDTQYINVVGVVKEIQMIDPRAGFTPVGTYYFPQSQAPSRSLVLALRTRTDDAAVMATVRQKIAAIDPQLPLYDVQPAAQYIDDALAGRRVPMYVALLFGGVGLFLSAIGIYGVLAYSVAQRRREIGVRMALGGSVSSVFTLVLGDGVKITAFGLALGLAGAFFIGGLMQTMLFGVSPLDPWVVGGVAAALVTVALVASVIPSWRATRINPIAVLGK